MTDGLTLIVGKNNTGKTSFAVLLEKFLTNSTLSFNYHDFPVSLRDKLHGLSEETNPDELTIRLSLCIEYSDEDSLENISEFMLDLDPERTTVNILFEAKIDKGGLLGRLSEHKEDITKRTEGIVDAQYQAKRNLFIERNIHKFIKTSIYAYDDFGYEGAVPYYLENRDELEKKEFKHVRNILNFQIIHAKRKVASSDESGKRPLSSVTTSFFNKLDNADDDHRLDQIRDSLLEIDKNLEAEYRDVFSEFLSNAGSFLNLDGLKVISDIEASSLIESSSKVIYGSVDNHLPENLNGLGYLNILYLLLNVEMAKKEFETSRSDINLLFIEEPEAHTHPQMQSIFSQKIREIINDISDLQSIISTHSSYIVSNAEFEDIRYLSKTENDVQFKNFHTDLVSKYIESQGKEEGAKLYQFLEQYLKIQNAELFFTDKAIFIEGTTERMLLPLFIKEFDLLCENEEEKIGSQNISIIEAGANAKAFAPFLEFIGVKALIITDFDSTKKIVNEDTDRTTYQAYPANDSTHTSNETLKHFFKAPPIKDIDNKPNIEFDNWFINLKNGDSAALFENVNVVYQTEEAGYHARSFEDAFINVNKQEIKQNRNKLLGLKKKQLLEDIDEKDIYKLTNDVLDKKSDFAASVLYLALTNEDVNWTTPTYIKEGLKWISQ
jgi:predicted ATP-dependent endonuclease of OLD family